MSRSTPALEQRRPSPVGRVGTIELRPRLIDPPGGGERHAAPEHDLEVVRGDSPASSYCARAAGTSPARSAARRLHAVVGALQLEQAPQLRAAVRGCPPPAARPSAPARACPCACRPRRATPPTAVRARRRPPPRAASSAARSRAARSPPASEYGIDHGVPDGVAQHHVRLRRHLRRRRGGRLRDAGAARVHRHPPGGVDHRHLARGLAVVAVDQLAEGPRGAAPAADQVEALRTVGRAPRTTAWPPRRLRAPPR